MIKLHDITLIALTGIDYKTSEHAFALEKSCEGIEWGDVKLIQLKEITDIDSWNKAVIYELPKYIFTDYCMFIHNDGYVIRPALWNDIWLKYDFVGAPWPLPIDDYSYRDELGDIVRVGNSVSLRSKKLMDRVAKIQWRPYFGNTNEDGFIAVHHKKELEKEGFKFAPIEIAKHFSKEHEIEENRGLETFAFHSL